MIETIQVAPRIKASEVIVQTKVKNYGPARQLELRHADQDLEEKDAPWRNSAEGTDRSRRGKDLHADHQDSPCSISGRRKTRFCMRWRAARRRQRPDAVWDARVSYSTIATRRGFLNGKPYYLRGGNIELHLHVEDPLCGDPPWDRPWVRKLIAEIPKSLNWNAFRCTIGGVPDMWLDIADEEGILIQLEPCIWGYREHGTGKR